MRYWKYLMRFFQKQNMSTGNFADKAFLVWKRKLSFRITETILISKWIFWNFKWPVLEENEVKLFDQTVFKTIKPETTRIELTIQTRAWHHMSCQRQKHQNLPILKTMPGCLVCLGLLSASRAEWGLSAGRRVLVYGGMTCQATVLTL